MTGAVPHTVASSDDVVVAVHELAGDADPDHPLVLVAHATGFHARAYLPLAAALVPPYHVVGLDSRGHGDTARPPDWQVDWTRYGDDAVAVAEAIAATPGGEDGLIGFGHSLGGASLLMAAHRRPELFRILVLFEPIVFPPVDEADLADRPSSPLAIGARRRRAVFDSIEAAIANYASKPPMQAFDPAALDAYVRYGFGRDPDGPGVRLKCEPEHEARTFDQSGRNTTWELLPEIKVATLVMAGVIDESRPAAVAASIAERLPNGRYLSLPHLDHFGPMTHPGEVADLVAGAVTALT